MLNDEKRGVEEAYASATTTSDMRVVPDADKQGDAETIMAAGMSSVVAGACFMRLHGEWSRAEKPRLPTADAIKRLSDSLTFDQLAKMRIDLGIASIGNLKPSALVAHMAAEAQARAWYVDEVGALLGKMQSFRSARDYLAGHLSIWSGHPEPIIKKISLMVLIWWLDKQCKTCDGTKWEVAPGSNRQSNKPCKVCRGSGIARLPASADGRRLANYIDDCVQNARTSIKKRLRRD
jgi:hypothetical protein